MSPDIGRMGYIRHLPYTANIGHVGYIRHVHGERLPVPCCAVPLPCHAAAVLFVPCRFRAMPLPCRAVPRYWRQMKNRKTINLIVSESFPTQFHNSVLPCRCGWQGQLLRLGIVKKLGIVREGTPQPRLGICQWVVLFLRSKSKHRFCRPHGGLGAPLGNLSRQIRYIGFGSEIPDPGSQIRDPGSDILDPRSRIRDLGSEIPNPRSRIRDPGSEIPDPRSRNRDPGSEILDLRSQIRDPRSPGPVDLLYKKSYMKNV